MPKELQDQLDAFMDSLNRDADDEMEDAIEAPDGKSGSSESDEADDPGADSDEEGLEAEARDQEGGEEGEDKNEEEPNEIVKLRQELADLKALFKKTPEKEKEPEVPVPSFDLKPVVTDIDILGGQTYEDIIEDSQAFTKFAKNLSARVQEATQEAIFKQLPQIIQSYTDQQIQVTSRTQDFYKANPDLAKHKKEVAEYANLIHQAKPELEYDQFFEEVAKYTRYMLDLDIPKSGQKKGEAKEKAKTKPALNNKSSRAAARMTNKPQLSGMEKEIADMLDKLDD